MKNTKTVAEYKDFGDRLRLSRQLMNLKQEELSAKTKISVSSICAYEGGRAFPHQERLERLALVLDVTTRYLSFGKSIINKQMKIRFNDKDTIKDIRAGDIKKILEHIDNSISNYDGIGKLVATITLEITQG